MPRRPRRNNSPAVKSKVALAAVKGDKAISELSQQFDVHPNQIRQWKTQLLGELHQGKPQPCKPQPGGSGRGRPQRGEPPQGEAQRSASRRGEPQRGKSS